MDTSLNDFIEHARKKGMDHGTIRMLLLSAGWKEKDVAQALSAQTLDMPVPPPPDVGGAREAFFHLLTFACLYTGITSLIVLLFTYVNRLLPDAAVDGVFAPDADLSSIRWWMAALIVTSPLFLWLSRSLLRDIDRHPDRALSGVRRWLTYLTLFAAAMTMVGDAIALVFNVLDGELSLRFLLKVLIVLALAGLTFVYYFVSLRGAARREESFHRAFGITTAVIAILSVAWGLWLAGSPAAQRLRKLDERRVQDLQTIQSEITAIVYGGQPARSPSVPKPVKPLPATLQEVLSQAQYQRPSIADPQTGQPYEYVVRDPRRYDLCAVFSAPLDQPFNVRWNHPAGHQCFSFDVQEGMTK